MTKIKREELPEINHKKFLVKFKSRKSLATIQTTRSASADEKLKKRRKIKKTK